MIKMEIIPATEAHKKAKEILKDFWGMSFNFSQQPFLLPIYEVVKIHNDYFQIKGKITNNRFKNMIDQERVYTKIHDLGCVSWICDDCKKAILITKKGMKRLEIQQRLNHRCDLSKDAFLEHEEFKNKIEFFRLSEINKKRGVEMLEFYEDEKGSGIRSNAKDEREFLDWVSELIANMITHSFEVEGMDWEERENGFKERLRNYLPKIAEMCCKYRGYKSDVLEQRVLITGQILGGEPQFSLNHKKDPEDD